MSISLYANILTTYRTYGLDNIEKQMDLELTKKEYWSQYLKSIDTSFGYIESYSNILTCNKSKSTLRLYKRNSKNRYYLDKEYSAFTGKLKGDKIKEGDLRTPIGIYNLTKKISKLDSFYGPLAFVTSYPNSYDKFKGKNGSGIWIHGLPTQQKRDDFTKGCIAINNSNIEALDRRINIDKTLLIINPKEVKKKISKKTLTSILASLYEWRYAWLYNDIDKYLQFYSSDFIRFDGMNFQRFKKYKTRIFKKPEKKTIMFNNISVIPYPNSSNIYQITFKEFYKSNSYAFNGNKVLMIKLDNKNNMKIFTER
jgi:murein L,D-transpeptidase YafK